MAALDAVVVATDAEEVLDACRSVDVPAVLTSPEHPSGTDRVAEVAELERYRDFPLVVNLQGDEPLLDEGHVRAAVEEVRRGSDVGTCATPVRTAEAWRSASVVKVVRREDGRALYFSRAPIPAVRDGDPETTALGQPPFLRHLGLYAYRRDALLRWVALPESTLEKLERLEQLRALEAGMSIGVAVVPRAEEGVDTLEDVERVEQRMRELGLGR
jgi:3-deoxy-manno-octulosonate cytidylyltransferase (CMP-KDO synthetase)